MTAHTYTTLVLGFEVSPDVKSKLDKTFHTVHYHPDGSIPDKAWRESDVCFAMPNGLPDTLKLEQVPNLHLVQILSGRLARQRWKGGGGERQVLTRRSWGEQGAGGRVLQK